MSDSDSQNVSGRDYDEGDEAVSESFSPSMGGSTFNQIDEVEHVSPNAEENEGPLRPTASTEDVSSSGRGKSPRVVVSKMFPHLNPRTVEEVTVSIRHKGVPRELQAPSFPKRTRALTDAAAKISSEVYDYLIFRTPEGYKNANLEPPDYDRDEKYEPVSIAVPAVKGMSPDKTFIAPAAAPLPKTKVALGAKRAAAKPTADPPIIDVPDPTPTDASSGGGAAPDLPVALGPSRRGKEKRQEAKIEEVLTLKRTKRPASTRSSDLHEGLRERDALASTLVDQIRDKLTHTTTDLFSRARALEGIREKEVVPLQKQVSAAERRIQELEKELAAAEDRAEKKLGEAEGRAERAEQAEKEAIDKMKDANSLARFICTDEAIAKEFLTAFINTEVGDKLTWVYGQWAFSSGCRAIQEQVHTALTEGLEETDLPAVLALLPSEVADPGPRPYSKPACMIGHLTPEMGTLLPSASKAIRSATNIIGHLTPEMGTLLPLASKAIRSADIRSADQDNRAPYSRDRHLAPIGLEGHKVGRPT
nr:serine/arginine repetitive matrix protein 2-like [Ipomoea batatas]